MKKSYLLVLALVALVPAIGVAAQHHHVPGSICVNPYSTNDDGVINGVSMTVWGSLGIQVGCPVPFTATSSAPVTVNPSAYRVDYVDLNATNDFFFSGAVGCQLYLVTSTGLTVSSGWRYSCATAGGCTTGDNSYAAGLGYLSGPDTIGATANTVGMSFVCNVPGYDSANGGSTLMGLAASTSAP